MMSYQSVVRLPGTILGLLLLVGLVGVVQRWRTLGGPVLLPWLGAVGLVLAPAATAEFDYRYLLPAVPLACLAAAITLRHVRLHQEARAGGASRLASPSASVRTITAPAGVRTRPSAPRRGSRLETPRVRATSADRLLAGHAGRLQPGDLAEQVADRDLARAPPR